MKNNDVLLKLNKLKKYFPLKRDGFLIKNKLFVRANEDITLDIKKGETLGLVGESGCGKSTLGRAILQLYTVTSGSAIYYGEELEKVNPKYLRTEYAKLPTYQRKAITAYEKSVKIDETVDKLRKQMDAIESSQITDKSYLGLQKKYEKLVEKSKDYRKESSRQLREASRSVGSLILEEKISEISSLYIESANHIAEISQMLNQIDQDYMAKVRHARKEKQYTDIKQEELKAWKKEQLELAEPKIQAIRDKVAELKAKAEAFKGTNRLKINERIDDKYALKLDKNKEDGINLSRLSSEEIRKMRQKLQIIFQDPYSSLDSRMSVGQIISEAVDEHGLYKRNTPEMEAYVLDVMKKCGLDPYMIHRYPHQFSGGQRQRIGIARALALKPEFIVADEPVSALDVSIQSQILNLLYDLKKENKLTYLFISHDLSVIKHISDRIGVMYLGNMVELADADEIYENPLHPYTKALISAIPTVEATGKKRILLKGDIPSNIFPPSGCKFRTRCPIATDLCAKKVPEYKEVSKNHYVACHFYEKTKDI